MVGRQLNAPAAFTPGEIPGTHFQMLSRPQGTWFCRGYHGKNPPVTPPGIDPGTVRLVAQRLNHYATPGPLFADTPQYIREKRDPGAAHGWHVFAVKSLALTTNEETFG